jgi:hypothetical protein
MTRRPSPATAGVGSGNQHVYVPRSMYVIPSGTYLLTHLPIYPSLLQHERTLLAVAFQNIQSRDDGADGEAEEREERGKGEKEWEVRLSCLKRFKWRIGGFLSSFSPEVG